MLNGQRTFLEQKVQGSHLAPGNAFSITNKKWRSFEPGIVRSPQIPKTYDFKEKWDNFEVYALSLACIQICQRMLLGVDLLSTSTTKIRIIK